MKELIIVIVVLGIALVVLFVYAMNISLKLDIEENQHKITKMRLDSFLKPDNKQ